MDSAGLSMDPQRNQGISGFLAAVYLKQKEQYPGSLLTCMMEIRKPGWYGNRGLLLACRTGRNYFCWPHKGRILDGKSDEWPLSLGCRKTDGAGCYPDFGRWNKMVWLFAKIKNILESWLFQRCNFRRPGIFHFRVAVCCQGWLVAIYDKEKNKVLHMATNLRYGNRWMEKSL